LKPEGGGNYPHENRILEVDTLWVITVSTENWRITVGVVEYITVGDTLVVITVGGTLVVTVRRIGFIRIMVITVGECVTMARTGAWSDGLSAQGVQTQPPTAPRDNMGLRWVQGARSRWSGPTSCSGYIEWRFAQPHGCRRSMDIWCLLGERAGTELVWTLSLTSRKRSMRRREKGVEQNKNPIEGNEKSRRPTATGQWAAK